MIRKLILAALLVLACSVGALATDITVGGLQINNFQRPGTVAQIRIWYSSPNGQNIVDSNGVPVLVGAVGTSSVYKIVICSLNSSTHVLTIPSFTIPSTNDSSQPNSRVTARIYDSAGTPVTYLFTNWIIPYQLGANPTFAQLNTYNAASPVQPAPMYPTTDQVLVLINSAVGTLNDASTTVKGRTYLDVDPIVPIHPEAVGSNSARVPPAGAIYWAINYPSFADAVTAMGTTVPVRLIVSEQMAVAADVTVTPNIQLQFVGNGRLIVATNKTVTIQGPLLASANWIFDVSASTSAISFSGNKSIPYYFLEWWGAKGDAVYQGANGIDNGPLITAAFNSVPTDAVITSGNGEQFGIATQVSLQGIRNVKLKGWNRIGNLGGGAAATFLWTGSGAGPMFAFDSCQGITVEGWFFLLQTGKTVDGFIDIDGAGAPNGTISTNNFVQYCAFNATAQANANFKAVSISKTSPNNNEHMNVSHNFFMTSSYVNTRISSTGSITSGTPNLTVTGLSLTSADNGKRVRVGLAGGSGTTLDTTILTVTSGTTATLAVNATATVAGARVIVDQALGVGIYNGPSANALHQTFEDNNIFFARYGIQFANGSGLVQDLQGGGNEVDVYINNCIGDGIEIIKVATEGSRQAVVLTAVSSAPVVMRQMRNANDFQLTEAYYVLDGVTRLEGSQFSVPPPTSGKLIASRGSGNLRFTSASTDYTTSTPPITMALAGFTAILNNGTGDIVDMQGAQGISDAPGFNFTNASRSDSTISSSITSTAFGGTLQVSNSGGPYADLAGVRGTISNNPAIGSSRILVGISGEIAAGSGNPSGTDTIGVRSLFPASLGNGGGAADYFGFKFISPTTTGGNHRDGYGLYLGAHPGAGISRARYGIYQAGVADINVLLGTLQLNGILFANLPASPVAGMVRTVTDSNTIVWGAAIAGGGASTVLAFYDGTNWTVFAK